MLRKELATLFVSPVPYVVGALFQAVLGVLVVDQLQVRGQAVVQPVVPIAGFLLLFTLPVLTMRTVAEESRTGTLDLLLVAGVPPGAVVVGKWLAAWVAALVVLAPAGLVVVLVAWWGEPDPGPAVAGFLGLALLAGALAGVGVLASACTTSQPVAAMVATFGVLVLWFAHVGSSTVTTGSALAAASLSERLRTFAGGGIDTADVAYFLALGISAVTAAALVVDVRRLR